MQLYCSTPGISVSSIKDFNWVCGLQASATFIKLCIYKLVKQIVEIAALITIVSTLCSSIIVSMDL